MSSWGWHQTLIDGISPTGRLFIHPRDTKFIGRFRQIKFAFGVFRGADLVGPRDSSKVHLLLPTIAPMKFLSMIADTI